MFEWTNGQREVYSFEGDYDTYTLMSRAHSFTKMVSNPVELPQNACTYLWVVCTYVTSILGLVVVLLWVYGLRAPFQVDGRNLFLLNRLVGGAWIGRPFLFLRATTAIFVLSTSHVTFASHAGLSKFDFSRRPWWHTLVLAGEATWITYTLNDMLIPMTRAYSALYSPCSALLAWVLVVLMELASPYRAVATIGRQCAIVSFTRGLECTGGDIHVGNPHRVLELVVITVGSALVSFAAVATTTTMFSTLRPLAKPSKHVLFSSTSEAFLLDTAADATHVDVLACVLSGILPIKSFLFDIKIWVAFPATRVKSYLYSLPHAALDMLPRGSVAPTLPPPAAQPPARPPPSTMFIRSTGFAGLVFMLGSVVSSFLYLTVSRTSLANDFLWPGFTDTDAQAFLCNWFNKQLQYGSDRAFAKIDDPRFGLLAMPNNDMAVKVASSALYAISVQDEANSLPNVVTGLRAMNGCRLPWVATSYCFADFAKTWEMAHTDRRQRRCQRKTDNAAVFLEPMLRNAPWGALMACWGNAFDVAVFAFLKESNAGRDWIASLQHPPTNAAASPTPLLDVAGEVSLWRTRGVTRFTTQWQNYKSFGVTETFVVSNALGVEYPITLKQSNGTDRVSAATSFRMFWPLTNDLTEVARNRTVLGGKSLLRSSPSYAFANATYFAAMVDVGVLVAPLDPALAIFQATFGPFGVVDLRRVPVLPRLRALHRSMSELLTATLSQSDSVQVAFWKIYTVAYFTPQPKAWDAGSIWGGDVLCGRNYGGSFSIPFQFFSANGLCGNFLNDYIATYTPNILLSALASGVAASNASTWHEIALRDWSHYDATLNVVNGSVGFIDQFIPVSAMASLADLVQRVKREVRDDLRLELVQYLSLDNDASYVLSRVNLFDTAEPELEFFAWLYLFDWVEGKREVVELEGDVDTLTTLSTVQNFDERLVNEREVPLNVSFYFLMVIQYVTAVLFGVGMLVCMYILSSRGYIEGIHMLSFNFIAGHVWCGRTLVLLRGLTAMALLATANLNLVRPRTGLLSYFDSPAKFWGTTALSASETSWLTFVIVDVLSVFSGHVTSTYCTLSTLLVCAGTAIWSFSSPTTHAVAVGRACQIASFDNNFVCTSGRMAIGDVSRFRGLVGLAFGGCALSYVLTRLWYLRRPVGRLDHVSYLLHSAAKLTFEDTMHGMWTHKNVYYIDKASAALTGVLSYGINECIYLLDIKMWRVYVIPTGPRQVPAHLAHAIPLME